jgi:hypothetical protein
LNAAVFVVLGLVAAPALAHAAAAGADQEVKKDKSIQMDKTAQAKAPDAALLDYLGSYADAADGLDPLGLAEPDAAPADPQHKEQQ